MNLGQFFADNENLFKEENEYEAPIIKFYERHGLFGKNSSAPIKEIDHSNEMIKSNALKRNSSG